MTTVTSPQVRGNKGQPEPKRSAAEDHVRVLRAADRACCCAARPSVIAVMPPAPGREHPTELLFCNHHYRDCRSRLAEAGAIVFDSHGAPITHAQTAH